MSIIITGPFTQNKPAGQRGGSPVKATTMAKMNFPAYSPPSNIHVSPSRISSPPVRSSSMREFHTAVRGEMTGEVGVSHGGVHVSARPSATHRSVSMSTQNLTDHHQRRNDNQAAYHHPPHHHVANKPRRSQSFNEKSMSSGYGSGSSSSSGGGSIAQGGLSSSSTSSTGSSISNTMEYPSKTSSHHSHSHGGGIGGYRTYPLRETSSLQTLPSSASYAGGNAGQGMDSRPHQNKHASHHGGGGHHGHNIRSSSVRNIPSASSAGYNITTTTTTSAVSRTTSSSAGQSSHGRPIFSQPISATAARVESVDIPTQPQPSSTSSTMATNVRVGSSSSSRAMTSGQIHGESGRGENNPKPSRRHLHKVKISRKYFVAC